MKKLLIVFLIILSITIIFSKSSNDKTVIKFSTWGSKSEIEILKPIIKEFENQNSDVKVELLHIPQNYFQKIHLLFASNTAPDVIFINNLNLPFFAKAKVLKPIDKDMKGFDLKAVEALSFDGKVYAVPRDISIVVIFRNRDIFKECNVGLNSPDWTLDEFLETSKKIKACGKFAISFEESPALFYLPYIMSEGGELLDEYGRDLYYSENTQTGLMFYSNLRKKYNTAPTKSQSANLTMAQMFLQQKLAMHLTGHWLVPKYKQEANFDWDTITFPKGKYGSVTPLDASGWAISASSKHPLEAQRFIDFLSSKENIEKMAQNGLIIPARLDVLNGKFSNDSINKAFINALKTTKKTISAPNYSEFMNIINQRNEKLFN